MAASTLALLLAAAALLVAVLVLVPALLWTAAGRRRDGRRAATLAARVEDLERRVEQLGPPTAERPRAAAAEFVITDLGQQADPDQRRMSLESVAVPDRVVLSGTLGEPLVRGFALAHGLRRALSAESRNRIRFEMRREVRRARRRRKQEMREAWHQVRAEDGTAA